MEASSAIQAEPAQEVIQAAAFPERAEEYLAKLLVEHPQLADDISSGNMVCKAAVAVSDASRSLAEAVRRDPGLLDGLRGLHPEDMREQTLEDLLADLKKELAQDPDVSRWKRKQTLRIMTRDMVAGADLLSITNEISALADACLSYCFEEAQEKVLAKAQERGQSQSQQAPNQQSQQVAAVRMAIIGMGKLGGNELNYSSDVDVVFAHAPAPDGEDHSRAAARIARDVMAEMSAPGKVMFPVDADLRPEGTSGALSRTPDAHRRYFEKWARPWERQAWMKARFVCGDQEVANEVLNAMRDFVWRPDLDPEEIRYIRDLKRKVEESVAKSKGRDFKRGPGGIRDIEFSVQLLVLVRGRNDPLVRSANTLLALDALKRAGSIDQEDATYLSIAYRYLRTLEHRLQLRDERPVYEIPSDEESKDWLARVMGHRDELSEDGQIALTAVERFELQHARHVESVRGIEQRLFLRPTIEAVAARQPETWPQWEHSVEQLEVLGFKEAEQSARIVENLTAGISHSARTLSQVMPLLLTALAETPDPNIGLIRFDWITNGPHRSNVIVPALRDSPVCVERLCGLLGSSKMVAGALRKEPEFVYQLTEGDLTRTREDLEQTATVAMGDTGGAGGTAGGDTTARRNALRKFVRQEQLRIASRDLLEMSDIQQVSEELTELAEVSAESALRALGGSSSGSTSSGNNPVRFCIIGLGSFGGKEMLYTSDMDAVFIYAPPDGASASASVTEAAQKIAKQWMADMSAQTAEGRAWDVDIRLRPEGQGLQAHRVDVYRRYWAERARLWEFQSMLKARVVAGDEALGQEFMQALGKVLHVERDPRATADELWEMRKRIFAERAIGTEDVKRGPGGQLDVAFAVQLLQLIYGHNLIHAQSPNTLEACRAFYIEGVISHGEAEALSRSYLWCSRLVARQYLVSETPEGIGALPENPEHRLLLARVLGNTAKEPEVPASLASLGLAEYSQEGEQLASSGYGEFLSEAEREFTQALPEEVAELNRQASEVTSEALEAIKAIFARHGAFLA